MPREPRPRARDRGPEVEERPRRARRWRHRDVLESRRCDAPAPRVELRRRMSPHHLGLLLGAVRHHQVVRLLAAAALRRVVRLVRLQADEAEAFASAARRRT